MEAIMGGCMLDPSQPEKVSHNPRRPRAQAQIKSFINTQWSRNHHLATTKATKTRGLPEGSNLSKPHPQTSENTDPNPFAENFLNPVTATQLKARTPTQTLDSLCFETRLIRLSPFPVFRSFQSFQDEQELISWFWYPSSAAACSSIPI